MTTASGIAASCSVNGRVATFYASVSASFVIEQQGLPKIGAGVDGKGSTGGTWNGDSPKRRLDQLRKRHKKLGN